MFTGIVEETGTVRDLREDDGRRLRIGTSFSDLDRGQSISVSGVCLTVETHGEGYFDVFLSEETEARSYLGSLTAGDHVNLERALPAQGRFDGHIVQGHVDNTADVTEIEPVGEDWRLGIQIPDGMETYIVEKGSIAVDGISLTVASLSADSFTVAIVPETYEVTAISELAVGDPVHLEVDILAKYVESMVADRS